MIKISKCCLQQYSISIRLKNPRSFANFFSFLFYNANIEKMYTSEIQDGPKSLVLFGWALNIIKEESGF